MSIENITYREITDMVLDFIKTEFTNTYHVTPRISDVMLAGWEQGERWVPGGRRGWNWKWSHSTDGPIYNIVITKFVPLYEPKHIEENFELFLTNTKIQEHLDENIIEGEYINFINNMIIYCSNVMRIATSEYTDDTFLIFIPTTDFNYDIIIDNVIKYDVIEVSDIENGIRNIILDGIKSNVRNFACQYTYELRRGSSLIVKTEG